MFFRTLIVLVLSLTFDLNLADESFIGLEYVINNLVTQDNTELVLISDFENGLTEDEEKKTIALGIFIVIGTAAAIYIICIAIILLIHKIRKNCCNKLLTFICIN